MGDDDHGDEKSPDEGVPCSNTACVSNDYRLEDTDYKNSFSQEDDMDIDDPTTSKTVLLTSP
jgi:hypothetical protein